MSLADRKISLVHTLESSKLFSIKRPEDYKAHTFYLSDVNHLRCLIRMGGKKNYSGVISVVFFGAHLPTNQGRPA